MHFSGAPGTIGITYIQRANCYEKWKEKKGKGDYLGTYCGNKFVNISLIP